MNQIKVKTEPQDPHVGIFVVSETGRSVIPAQYGHIGQGTPYFLESDLRSVLITYKERTDAERFQFIARKFLKFEVVTDLDGELDFIEVWEQKKTLTRLLVGSHEGFETIKEAVDYLMDMEEV